MEVKLSKKGNPYGLCRIYRDKDNFGFEIPLGDGTQLNIIIDKDISKAFVFKKLAVNTSEAGL